VSEEDAGKRSPKKKGGGLPLAAKGGRVATTGEKSISKRKKLLYSKHLKRDLPRKKKGGALKEYVPSECRETGVEPGSLGGAKGKEGEKLVKTGRCWP